MRSSNKKRPVISGPIQHEADNPSSLGQLQPPSQQIAQLSVQVVNSPSSIYGPLSAHSSSAPVGSPPGITAASLNLPSHFAATLAEESSAADASSETGGAPTNSVSRITFWPSHSNDSGSSKFQEHLPSDSNTMPATLRTEANVRHKKSGGKIWLVLSLISNICVLSLLGFVTWNYIHTKQSNVCTQVGPTGSEATHTAILSRSSGVSVTGVQPQEMASRKASPTSTRTDVAGVNAIISGHDTVASRTTSHAIHSTSTKHSSSIDSAVSKNSDARHLIIPRVMSDLGYPVNPPTDNSHTSAPTSHISTQASYTSTTTSHASILTSHTSMTTSHAPISTPNSITTGLTTNIGSSELIVSHWSSTESRSSIESFSPAVTSSKPSFITSQSAFPRPRSATSESVKPAADDLPPGFNSLAQRRFDVPLLFKFLIRLRPYLNMRVNTLPDLAKGLGLPFARTSPTTRIGMSSSDMQEGEDGAEIKVEPDTLSMLSESHRQHLQAALSSVCLRQLYRHPEPPFRSPTVSLWICVVQSFVALGYITTSGSFRNGGSTSTASSTTAFSPSKATETSVPSQSDDQGPGHDCTAVPSPGTPSIPENPGCILTRFKMKLTLYLMALLPLALAAPIPADGMCTISGVKWPVVNFPTEAVQAVGCDRPELKASVICGIGYNADKIEAVDTTT
jgi:hypothetical protein